VVFDWDPAVPMSSGSPGRSRKGGGKRSLGPRGTDPRLYP
jgi:hypothetical protein